MHNTGSPSRSGNILQWGVRNNLQAFVQPTTIPGITLNAFGWIDTPTAGELILPMYQILPDEEKTMYWFSEKIVCNSSNPVRFSLQGNFDYDETIGDFSPDGWRTVAGYMLNETNPHFWESNIPIKTKAGEALRLVVYGAAGNNNDFYFKFIGVELKWKE